MSLLEAVGLGDSWVARNEEEYVQLAVQHAANLPALEALRESLRDRMLSSALCDGPVFVEQLESLYQQLYKRWLVEGPWRWHAQDEVAEATAYSMEGSRSWGSGPQSESTTSGDPQTDSALPDDRTDRVDGKFNVFCSPLIPHSALSSLRCCVFPSLISLPSRPISRPRLPASPPSPLL